MPFYLFSGFVKTRKIYRPPWRKTEGGYIMPENLMNENIIMPDDTATASGEGQQASTEQVDNSGNTAQAEQATTQTTTPETTQATTQTTTQEQAKDKQEKIFRQADVDRIVQERLARERQKFEAELKNHSVLSYLQQKAQRLGITVEQLIENDRKYEEQQALNELIQKNIPEEYAREMLENRKFREQYMADKNKWEEQERRQQMYMEFIKAYPDVEPNKIPPEVWQEVEQGKSLLDAYIRYENKLLKEQTKQLQQQQQTEQANNQNAETSTGSVKNLERPDEQDPFLIGFDSYK